MCGFEYEHAQYINELCICVYIYIILREQTEKVEQQYWCRLRPMMGILVTGGGYVKFLHKISKIGERSIARNIDSIIVSTARQ